MSHHVVYHSDVDGIFSGGLYLKYGIKSIINYRLHPVASYSRGEKFNELIKNLNLGDNDTLSIFDFEDHKQSTFWVDHHPNKDLGHKPVSNDETIYDPAAYSAFQLIFNYLRKTSEECSKNMHLPELVKHVNMIDAALYPNVNFVFTNASPIMIIRAYLEMTIPNDMIFNRILEILANTEFDLDETIEILNLNASIVEELHNSVMKAKQSMEVYNKISVIRQRRTGQFPRYSEAFIRPDVKYNIRISSVWNKRWHLQVSFNKWHEEKNDLHIGRFLANLDYVKGGGHYNVGGGFIKEDSVDTFIDDFSNITNNYKEELMEKYAVDKKDDQFENKAENLIKTGEAKNIDDAREKVKIQEAVSGTAEPNSGNS
jgi:hypothetical protein